MSRAALRGLVSLLFGASLLGWAGSAKALSLGRGGCAVVAPEKAEEHASRKHEELYKVINFLLLAGGLAFLLRKPLAGFFAQRSNSIQRALEDGRQALEASQAQLAAVEEKLRRLDEEIAAFKASAVREMELERQRLKQAAAEEAERALQAARAQLEMATRAARIELKAYAAQQAVELAEGIIRRQMDEAGRRRLVNQFIASLDAKKPQN